MFKLLFHVDSPLATGLVTLAASFVVLFLVWAYDRDTIVGKALKWFFGRKLTAVERETAEKIGRWVLVSLTLVLGTFALFGIAVGSGLVQNGDPPRLLTIKDFHDKRDKTRIEK